MKTLSKSLIFLATLASCAELWGQGTFLYDQQSASEGISIESAVIIQNNSPIGQSFTPSLSGVGFARLYVGDNVLNGIGATLRVDLITGSFTNGTLLGSSQRLILPDGYAGRTNFIFGNAIPVTPGTTYYFQVVVESGDPWRLGWDTGYNYAGGTAFANGLSADPKDLWFREGIIVPEPGGIWLAVTGLGLALFKKWRVRSKRET